MGELFYIAERIRCGITQTRKRLEIARKFLPDRFCPMSTRKSLLALCAIPLFALAACGTEKNDAPSPSTVTVTSGASTTPTTSKPQPSPTTKKSTEQASAPIETETQPYVVECLEGVPGPSLMSDGTMQNTTYCQNQPGAQESRDAESAAGLDPSQIPYANGGTCPAYKCGYGTDENGNPNPSSGELQTLDGCDEGYITDQSLCGAVRNKADQYGW